MTTLRHSQFCYLLVVLLLSILSASPLAVNAQTPDEEDTMLQNPVIQMNFPDPFILPMEDGYYAYSTNSNSRHVPVAYSTDLVKWESHRDAMPALAKWVNISSPNVWAPEVLPMNGQFLLYYTARDKTSDRQCIGLAVSESPDGPFRDRSDAPFICQVDQGGSIDASPFRDADGTLYLYWKNDGNCCMMATRIYVQQLSPDGLELMGEPVALIRNEHPWEGTVIEAPTMWLQNGRYYLFYSGNMFATERYAVGYATCDTPLGPCQHADENPILASDIANKPLVIGPGHQTVFTDRAEQTWIVYHAWQVTRAGQRTDNRQVWLDRLDWVDGRPVVRGPTREAQPAPITTVE